MAEILTKEWEQEPDKLDYVENEFKVAIRRVPGLGHLCGYVAIPQGHPLYGYDYDDYPLDVHGGLTFGREGDGGYLPKGFWWIGFDCAHSGDYSPRIGDLLSRGPREYETYRNIEYVKRELWSLTYELQKLSKLCWRILEKWTKERESCLNK